MRPWSICLTSGNFADPRLTGASKTRKASRTLGAIGISPVVTPGSIVSIINPTSRDEVADQALHKLPPTLEKLRFWPPVGRKRTAFISGGSA